MQAPCHSPSCVILNSQNATYVFTKSSCCSITSRVLLRLQMRLCFVGAYLLWVLASQNRFTCGASASNMMDELASGCTSSEMSCHELGFSHTLNIRHTVPHVIQWQWSSWSVFILVINQLEAQNLFYNKFILCLYMFRAPCARRQEVKIVLYSLWYYHNCRWLSHAQPVHRTATYRCDDTRGCIIQFLTSWRWAHGARNM